MFEKQLETTSTRTHASVGLNGASEYFPQYLKVLTLQTKAIIKNKSVLEFGTTNHKYCTNYFWFHYFTGANRKKTTGHFSNRLEKKMGLHIILSLWKCSGLLCKIHSPWYKTLERSLKKVQRIVTQSREMISDMLLSAPRPPVMTRVSWIELAVWLLAL